MTDAIKLSLMDLYTSIREQTEKLCVPLVVEDYVIQSIEDISPPKWHLAHTSWFFETFLLVRFIKDYKLFHPSFPYLFNSYYQALGTPYARNRRGVLSRPTVDEIYQYRHYVDQCVKDLLSKSELSQAIQDILILGLNHEQQHQELLLMDIKYNFSRHPDFPVYVETKDDVAPKPSQLMFKEVLGGQMRIGHESHTFCFDNEKPAFDYLLKPYAIANRLITNAEFLEFINADGYRTPEFWLADGWDWVMREKIAAPLYWHQLDKHWFEFRLNGLQALNLHQPVSHISYYEADAYAKFRGVRLPTEIEWEHYANQFNHEIASGNFLESQYLHPCSANANHQQLYGDLWEWTASAYLPYPGFSPSEGAVGEYNGKFMNNQMVLKGGACVTPKKHIRATYRNFFQPEKRWQFSGIRLAK